MQTTTTEHSEQKVKNFSTSHVTWGAIFAGVVFALIMEAVLNLLGLGLGFSAFTPTADSMSALGTGTVIWLIVTGIISMFCGGWIAGRLSGISLTIEGMLHGLVAWGLATLLLFMFMATTAGAIIGGAASLAGKGLALTGQAAVSLGKGAVQIAPQVAETAQNLVPNLTPTLDQIKQQANDVLAQVQNNSLTDEKKQQLMQAVTGLFQANDDNARAKAQQQLVNFLAENANMDQEKAQATVTKWQQQYQAFKDQLAQKAEQAKQKAAEMAEKASDALAAIALVVFFVLLLSAIASALGGWLGAHTNVKYYRD